MYARRTRKEVLSGHDEYCQQNANGCTCTFSSVGLMTFIALSSATAMLISWNLICSLGMLWMLGPSRMISCVMPTPVPKLTEAVRWSTRTCTHVNSKHSYITINANSVVIALGE